MVRVLHVLYSFLPDVTGSSIRSAGLLSGQLSAGIAPIAISSPFQRGFSDSPVDEYQGVRIHRAFAPGNPEISESGSSLRSRIQKVLLFPSFVQRVRQLAEAESVEVIHAHSTFYCGMAALIAGRLLGLRVVYEFRSLWEERSRSKGFVYRMQSGIARVLETLCLRGVDHVVTINYGLRDLVLQRGVSAENVSVIPNAVEADLLLIGADCPEPTTVRRFGYVGNFSVIEGLDLLVEAFSSLIREHATATLALWGTGPCEAELRQRVAALGDPRMTVNGRFKRGDVKSIYASLDCIVIPRRRSLLTDSVTPLKPLEAMAFGRLVAVSDARGLVEVTGGEENAVIFPADDVSALHRFLAAACRGVLPVERLARNGRQFVKEQRAWNSVARGYLKVYGAA